jgi:peroxiredoxin
MSMESMHFNAKAALLVQPGESMPGFVLPDTSGDIVRLKSFKQRRPVLVALLHHATCPECRAWLSGLSAARQELTALNVEPLLIFPDGPTVLRSLWEALPLPGHLLSDPGQGTLARYVRTGDEAPRQPTLLVAVDRYSYCLNAWLADEPARWPPLAEPLATFAFAEQEDCTCGMPIWNDQ